MRYVHVRFQSATKHNACVLHQPTWVCAVLAGAESITRGQGVEIHKEMQFSGRPPLPVPPPITAHRFARPVKNLFDWGRGSETKQMCDETNILWRATDHKGDDGKCEADWEVQVDTFY